MYLDNGQEVIPCDKYEGSFIIAETGDFCDEDGNLIGGNVDLGDTPGGRGKIVEFDVPDYVYVSKSGKQYYPHPTKTATKRIRLEEADAKGYKPSVGYNNFVHKLYKKYLKTLKKRK